MARSSLTSTGPRTGAALLASFLLLAGCSSGGSSTASGDGATPDASASAAASAAAAYIADKTSPPTGFATPGTPVTPPTGKKLGILSCGQASDDCKRMAADATTAAEALGWTATTVDGKLSPQGWATGLEQLVSQKPDVIVSMVVADSAVPEGLKSAHAAGIPVVCVQCANGFDKPVEFPSVANSDVQGSDQGVLVANAVIADSGGEAKIGTLTDALSVAVVARDQAVKETLEAKCPGCEMVESTEIGQPANLIGAAASATQAMLSQHGEGDLDYIISPADVFSPGIVQAVQAAGRTDVKVIGYDCNQQILDVIRSGGPEFACADSPLEWDAWAGVDLAVRLLSGDTSTTQVEIPFHLVTKDNVPAAGEWPTTFDYAGYYEGLWGVN